MIKTLVLIFMSFCSIPVLSAQENTAIYGKWKIIIADNGVRYHYKTGTTSVSRKFSDSLAGLKDSLETVVLFSSFSMSYDNYYFVFGKDGIYQEIKEGNIRLKGTYKRDTRNRLIQITVTDKSGKERQIAYGYKFVSEGLQLKIPSYFTEEELILVLEKTN